MEIYLIFQEKCFNTFTLQTFSAISIRNSITNFGKNKINELEIPRILKKEILIDSSSMVNTENFICFPYLI